MRTESGSAATAKWNTPDGETTIVELGTVMSAATASGDTPDGETTIVEAGMTTGAKTIRDQTETAHAAALPH